MRYPQRMEAPISIAVDPGYDRLGIAIFRGTTLIHSECYTPQKGLLPDRLLAVFEHIRATIRAHQPRTLAIETLFFNKNQRTAIAVAESRGAIIVAARAEGVRIAEYSPQEVKIAVTGVGNAPKEAVIRMVDRLVRLETRRRLDDEYDAIALGICHTARNPHTADLRAH